jgi:hypothetical protein
MKGLLSSLVFSSLVAVTFGQPEMNSGIIYGENHSYSLTAPDGWVLDNESGVNEGYFAVFYKKGESWAKGETVMYINTGAIGKKPIENLDKFT